MRKGGVGRSDPQFGVVAPIAAINNVHELHDGENFRIGTTVLTAHLTPGHTPGGTSWTWKSCENNLCRDMVYADSLTPVSASGFEFTHSREYPGALKDFENSFGFLQAVPCNVLITTHPEASGLWDRLGARQRGATPDPMVDSSACRRLAENGREQLRRRLTLEASRNPH